jgi:hypothetical protein
MTLQLTDPPRYQGGELQFQSTNLIETAPKDRGMLIAFPSNVLHRVGPVTAGTRKVAGDMNHWAALHLVAVVDPRCRTMCCSARFICPRGYVIVRTGGERDKQ